MTYVFIFIFFLLGENLVIDFSQNCLSPLDRDEDFQTKKWGSDLSSRRSLCFKSINKPNLHTVCRHCGKNFLFESRLKRHMYIHTGERPFVCQYCGKRFNQKASLGQHILIHSDKKPYMCDVCGKQFIKRSMFIAHSNLHSAD